MVLRIKKNMRKIEKAMLMKKEIYFLDRPFMAKWENGNTKVIGVEVFESKDYLVSVFLHDNLIYEERRKGTGEKETRFSLCGWNTPTTRSRLHALGVSVSQKKFLPYFNGKVIGANEEIILRSGMV